MPKTLKQPAFKIPKTLGACADLLADIRSDRLEAQKLVDAIAAKETELREHIIANLPKSEGGAVGLRHKVTIVAKHVPQVSDWEKFYGYVAKNKRFDMLQRRLSDAPIRELWDNGKKVPGVESFQTISLSLTKK